MEVVAPISKYKVVFLGDQSVGKTNIISRFMCDRFDTAYNATIGIDFLSKTMYLKDRTIRLQFWDTPGQERFRFLLLSYIRDSSVAVIVYDVANRQSFLNITKWIEEVRITVGDTNIIIVLVGNNVDHVDKRQVLTEEGDERARELGVMFIETSAFAGFNIKPLFQKIAFALLGMETLLSKKQEDMAEQKEDMDAGKHKDFMEVEDQRPPSSLKKKKTEEMQEIEGFEGRCHCGRMGGQRCEEMLKLIVEIQEGKRRTDERIKQVEFMVERARLDDIKRWEDMSKRLEEMRDNMFRRLEKLNSRNDPLGTVGYKESYELLKILRLKEVEANADDVEFVTKLYKRKRDDEIQKMEEDKNNLNPLKEPNLKS